MLELSWTRLMLAAACLLATTTACVVGDVGIEEENVWDCLTDEDCIDGQKCIVGDEGRAVCQDPGIQVLCNDNDNDTYFAFTNGPEDCPADTEFDCDDANVNVNPGAMELCNNVDDNCDGQVDENVTDVSCALTEGVCASATAMCVEGAPTDCSANCPGPDCGYGPDYVAQEGPGTCSDGIDNDCDGMTDDDPECPSCIEGEPCGTGCLGGISGAECGCAIGMQQCNPDGTAGDCVDSSGTPVSFLGANPEICSNGVDDNCTGQVDEMPCQ